MGASGVPSSSSARSTSINTAKPFLSGVPVLLRLNEPRPDFLVDRSGPVQPGGSVEAGNAALRQDAVGTQLGLAEVDRHLAAVGQMLRRRSPAAFPQREMAIVEHLRTSTGRDLRIAIGQYCRDKTHIIRKRAIEVALKPLGDVGHDPTPELKRRSDPRCERTGNN